MNDSKLRTEQDAMVNTSEERPELPDMDWDRYKEVTELQEQRRSMNCRNPTTTRAIPPATPMT